MKRRGIALIVVIALVCSLLPVGALAEEVSAEGTVGTYVSLGGSNVNGYGLRGYIKAVDGMTMDETYDSAALDSSIKDNANVLGYTAEAPGSYPVLIADALGYDLEQLAISSMRVEELRILLDNDYYGDSYSAWRFVGSGKWFEIATEGGIDTLREEYQAKIAEADFITVDIGANNFGVYISHQLTSNYRYDEDLALVDPEMGRVYGAAKTYVKELVVELLPEFSELILGMEQLIDTMAYALVGFCVNFDIVMEKIYALNPDATVVTVSIQNLMEGYEVAVPGVDGTLPLGELFGALVNAANIYIAVGSPYSESYLCADVRQNGRVECFLEDISAYNGDPTSLSAEVIDCFNVLDGSPGNGYDRNLHVKYMLYKYILTSVLGEVDEDYIAAMMGWYEVSSVDKLASKILLDAKSGFATAYAKGGETAQVLCQQVYAAYEAYLEENAAVVEAMLYAAYDAVASILQASAQVGVIDLGVLMGADEAEDAFEDAFSEQIMVAAMGVLEGKLDYELPENFFATVAEEAGVSLSAIESVAALYVRTDIGNTFFGHPNKTGHETVANAVLSSLENETTGMDIVDKELLGEYKAALYEATHGEYEVNCGSYYVSLGDSTVTGYGANDGENPEHYENWGYQTTVPVSFPYQLAEQLGLDVETQYTQLAMAGLRTADLRYILDETFAPDAYTLGYGVDRISDCIDAEVDDPVDYVRDTYWEELAQADLVTISIGNCNFSDYIKVQSMGLVAELIRDCDDLMAILESPSGQEYIAPVFAQYLDLDAEVYGLKWDNYLSDEQVGMLYTAIDEVVAMLVANGLPECEIIDIGSYVEAIFEAQFGFSSTIDIKLEIPMAEVAAYYLEWCAYAYISHAVDYEAVLDLIHECAPGAEVVVVGMFNPMDELVLVYEGMEIPLGEYVGYAVEAANLSGIVYAMMNADTTYVAVPDVESNADHTMEQYGCTMELMEYLATLVTDANNSQVNFHETVAGHTYIADCIYDALTVSHVEHIYDGGVVTKQPGCNTAGEKTYTCVICQVHSFTEEIPAMGHDMENGVCVNCGYVVAIAPVDPGTPSVPGTPDVDEHCAGCNGGACHSAEYADLNENAWYHEYTDYVLCNGLMNGVGDGTFGPGETTTRAMVVTILWRMEGCPVVNYLMDFEDVAGEQWYTEAIRWATSEGIVEGYGNGTFGLHNAITREQMATILWRYAQYKGYDVSAGEDTNILSYDDAFEVSEWAIPAVQWAAAVGLMEGRSASELAPAAGTTRAETATLFYRWCKEILK